jgi:hypothetical protein
MRRDFFHVLMMGTDGTNISLVGGNHGFAAVKHIPGGTIPHLCLSLFEKNAILCERDRLNINLDL